jgi:hypothetical protein
VRVRLTVKKVWTLVVELFTSLIVTPGVVMLVQVMAACAAGPPAGHGTDAQDVVVRRGQ